MITEQDLLFDQNLGNPQDQIQGISVEDKLGALPLKGIISEFEKEVIIQALRKYEGNVVEAAEQLRIGKTALYDKMKKYRISAKAIKHSL